MERLALHIEYLLRHHDCVIMPGIGAFIVARYPAYFEVTSQRWYPMRKEIRFNASINNDDGLIANSYSRKYSLSFNQGRQLLDSDLRRMKQLMERDGEVSIGRLGRLDAGDDTFVFSPFRTSSVEDTIIGYVSVPSVKEDNETNPKVDMINEEEGLSRRFDTDRNYYLPINKKGLKIAASLIVVFLAALAIILPSSNPAIEDKASVLPIVEINNNTQKASKTQSEFKSQHAAMAKEPTDAGNKVMLSVSEPDKEKVYYLIVGTFKTAEEADKYISYNKDKGYELEMVGTRTLQRVSAKSSTNRQQLLDLLNSSEFKSIFSEAWIWTRQQ